MFNRFIKNREQYCFASFDCSSFIGFTASSSINESFHALLKRIQPTEKEYTVTLRNLMYCCHYLLAKCDDFQLEKVEYEDIFKVKELKGVRLCLTKTIFSHFIAELAEVMRLEAIEKEDGDFAIR